MNTSESPHQSSDAAPSLARRAADAAQSARILRWIMGSVFAWGCFLALGAALYGVDPESGAITWAPQPLRGVIVFVSVTGLLVGWSWLLRQRARRT
jgi:hypothetical protein